MQFWEMLDFLMKTTQTSNRMLAQELKVDPSLISRFRTGDRNRPRQLEQLKAMSSYFAKRCLSSAQRQAIANKLNVKASLTAQPELLTEILYAWLCGQDALARNTRLLPEALKKNTGVGSLSPTHAKNKLYYGNAGKRSAAATFFNTALALPAPVTLYFYSDESDVWIQEADPHAADNRDWLSLLIEKGFQIVHIAPPTLLAEMAYQSLTRWLSAYATGKIEAYYYPGLRDQVHRRTLFIIPGKLVLSSHSIAHRADSYVSMLATDEPLVQAYMTEFHDYLSLCRPLLRNHELPDSQIRLFTHFFSSQGNRIQKTPALSMNTAPSTLIESCIQTLNQRGYKKISQYFSQAVELMHACRNEELIDLGYLARPEEVLAGQVTTTLACGPIFLPVTYTVSLYLTHLKNILNMLEQNENYHFVPLNRNQRSDYTFMVEEDQHAIILQNKKTPNVIELVERQRILLCWEYLNRTADEIGYRGSRRSDIKARLRGLIAQLEIL
ncbi:hypothetical protein [Holdemania massiliensis]|uniref:hypothetical protein n=1 Tax=Holdemania massiliensis TaxID=1468449 RepID=UPI001F06BBC8|nr:hypothetical protein [Holdemania massiliensis]MCH1942560.1 hypothetical protein [Holdemania massiliensis]